MFVRQDRAAAARDELRRRRRAFRKRQSIDDELLDDRVSQRQVLRLHFQVAECRLDPKPVQQPHLPILVGGHSAAALLRAARYGTGWYGFAIDPAQTAAVLKRLDVALAAEGRSRAGFEIVITPPYRLTDDMLREYKDLGVDRVIAQLGAQKPDAVAAKLAELERFVGVAA